MGNQNLFEKLAVLTERRAIEGEKKSFLKIPNFPTILPLGVS